MPRFRGTHLTRKYYAKAALSRELYGTMIARMSFRGHRTVVGYIRALFREDIKARSAMLATARPPALPQMSAKQGQWEVVA